MQVVDPVAGWTFREYGTTTWEFVLAAFRPKYLLCSATMSEASLSRAAGLFLTVTLNPQPSTLNPHHHLAGNMGLDRKSIKTFYKPPLKTNIFQEVMTIKKLSFRYNSLKVMKKFGLGLGYF